MGWEIALLFCGYAGMFLGVVPLGHRLIIAGVCFPLAALASWRGGVLTVKSLFDGEGEQAKIVTTGPVLVFLGVAAVAVITAVLVLLGVF